MDATPIQLAKSIAEMSRWKLGSDWVYDTRQAYAKTFLIVEMYSEGLIIPTKAARNRLLDLYKVLERRRNELVAAHRPV